MKTRDEQAHEYAESKLNEFKIASNGNSNARERLICFGTAGEAFKSGWDAALKSQWRDASEELPTDSIGKEFLIRVEYNDGSGFNHCSAAFINDHWNILDVSIDVEIDEGKAEITHWMPIPDLP